MRNMDKELNKYHHFNNVAENNGIVFFGSDSFLNIPFAELSRSFCIDKPVYNRSIEGLTLKECEKALKECVFELSPSKIFLGIGEEDVKKEDFDCEKFLASYEWLLYTIHGGSKGRIYIVSIIGNDPKISYVNQKLSRIADSSGCSFIDISAAANSKQTELDIFEILRCRLRHRSISMTEAFTVAT